MVPDCLHVILSFCEELADTSAQGSEQLTCMTSWFWLCGPHQVAIYEGVSPNWNESEVCMLSIIMTLGGWGQEVCNRCWLYKFSAELFCVKVWLKEGRGNGSELDVTVHTVYFGDASNVYAMVCDIIVCVFCLQSLHLYMQTAWFVRLNRSALSNVVFRLTVSLIDSILCCSLTYGSNEHLLPAKKGC